MAGHLTLPAADMCYKLTWWVPILVVKGDSRKVRQPIMNNESWICLLHLKASHFVLLADANWDKLAKWQSLLAVKWDSLEVKHLVNEAVGKWDSC